MDVLIEKAMNVIMRYGTVFKFKEYRLSLYYYYMASTDVQNSDKNNSTIKPYYMLSTVAENKEF